ATADRPVGRVERISGERTATKRLETVERRPCRNAIVHRLALVADQQQFSRHMARDPASCSGAIACGQGSRQREAGARLSRGNSATISFGSVFGNRALSASGRDAMSKESLSESATRCISTENMFVLN